MTRLERTTLTIPQKVEFAAEVLARQGEYGAISALSEQFGVSRPTAYHTAATTRTLLEEHFAPLPQPEGVRVVVDKAQLRRAVLALRLTAPNSIRAIEELLPLLYPGVRLSYGSIQAILIEAEHQALMFNSQANLSLIKAGALDEMFSQGDPVLAGVDLESGYLFGLSLRESRSGADWAEVLGQAKQQGLELSVVVKDAAAGIASGVEAVFPEAEQRDDCFHALYAMNKVRRRLEQRAYTAINEEQFQRQRLEKIGSELPIARALQQRRVSEARSRCQEAVEQFDRFERAAVQVEESMSYVDLQGGQLRSGEQVQQLLSQAAEQIQALGACGCHDLGRYLRNRAEGLSLATQALYTALMGLAERFSQPAVELTARLWRLAERHDRTDRLWQRNAIARQMLDSYARLRQRLGAQRADELLDLVKQHLDKRHRASSAIEGFNAALRPFLYVHKGVTDGFLELFRAHYNLRIRRWGRHKGTSAHQCLTGKKDVDWLSLLGFPPSATVH
jgi:hypothetical protein